ncbi:hypothetical protein Anapl_14792 [Anas platyrhynchos]|uniref:Uncharacterized protein n=1 Tax=Anas platyrhynchos TaxID=8839 RepID=R0J8X5_ANAPL|nr:hypothetical protein Anapl_14792 [Anas platyrhynchos]
MAALLITAVASGWACRVPWLWGEQNGDQHGQQLKYANGHSPGFLHKEGSPKFPRMDGSGMPEPDMIKDCRGISKPDVLLWNGKAGASVTGESETNRSLKNESESTAGKGNTAKDVVKNRMYNRMCKGVIAKESVNIRKDKEGIVSTAKVESTSHSECSMFFKFSQKTGGGLLGMQVSRLLTAQVIEGLHLPGAAMVLKHEDPFAAVSTFNAFCALSFSKPADPHAGEKASREFAYRCLRCGFSHTSWMQAGLLKASYGENAFWCK